MFSDICRIAILSQLLPPHVILTQKLNSFIINNESVICECGAHIKKIARLMTSEGIEGFYGLWDLPGTVAAAVYGNAGCFGCEMSEIFYSAEILTPEGNVEVVTEKEIGFSRRCSRLKIGDIKGVILRVVLKKRKGCLEEIQKKALDAHRTRLLTQPGPQNNLGSCFMSGRKKIWYRILTRLIACYLKVARKKIPPLCLELKILGYSHLLPYMFNMNRFIWKDERAYVVFDEYLQLYRKIHKNAKLEIKIFE